LKYAQATSAFAAPLGKIDVKTVAAGSTCGSAALSQINGVDVRADAVLTLARIGGSGAPEQVAAFPEAATQSPQTTKLRFVNAIPGAPPLYLGLARDTRMPTDVDTRLLGTAVPFGATPSPGDKVTAGTIDEHGYLVIAPNAYEMGAAAEGVSDAIL